MERMINQRNVFEHLEVIEALCKGISLNYDKPEIIECIFVSMKREVSQLLSKCYFESSERVEQLENMICDILDDPNSFSCLEVVYQIYVSLLTSLMEIQNENYLRNKKGLAV